MTLLYHSVYDARNVKLQERAVPAPALDPEVAAVIDMPHEPDLVLTGTAFSGFPGPSLSVEGFRNPLKTQRSRLTTGKLSQNVNRFVILRNEVTKDLPK